jgi:hypothetical protein
MQLVLTFGVAHFLGVLEGVLAGTGALVLLEGADDLDGVRAASAFRCHRGNTDAVHSALLKSVTCSSSTCCFNVKDMARCCENRSRMQGGEGFGLWRANLKRRSNVSK